MVAEGGGLLMPTRVSDIRKVRSVSCYFHSFPFLIVSFFNYPDALPPHPHLISTVRGVFRAGRNIQIKQVYTPVYENDFDV